MDSAEEPIKIFISHASARDGVSGEARDRYAKALDKAGFNVLQDVDLGEGDWRLELINMMMECHAAVILLGKNAITKSDWVSCESFLMRVRQYYWPDFRIYPVCLGNTTKEAICKSTRLGPSGLRELTIYSDPPALDAIIRDLKAFHPPNSFGRELQPYIERIQALLDTDNDKGLCSSAFKRVYQELNHPLEHDRPAALRDVLTYHITRSPLPTAIRALSELQGTSAMSEVYHCIAPLWMSNSQCIGLRKALVPAATLTTSGPIVESFFDICSGQHYELASKYTATWFLARSVGYPLKTAPGSNEPELQKLIRIMLDRTQFSSVEELCGTITERLQSELNIGDDDVSGTLRSRIKRKAPKSIVVLLPELAFSSDERDELYQRLQDNFPGIVWLEVTPNGTIPLDWEPEVDDELRHFSDRDKFTYYEAACLESYFEAIGQMKLKLRGPYVVQKDLLRRGQELHR